jgi:hypothetical protein
MLRCDPVGFSYGVAFSFFVGSHPPPAPVLSHCLNDKGEMTVSYQEAGSIPFLKEMILNFGRAIRQRERSD